MIGIYKITSPTNKIYIGQSVNIEKRFNDYRKLRNVNEQPKLFNSLIKYGSENHLFEVIVECIISELNDKERYYQELFNCIDSGLNCVLTNCSDRSGYLSDETKLKISITKKGQGKGIPKSDDFKKLVSNNNSKRIWKQESKDKISEYRKDKFNGENNHFYGKKHSKKTKSILSLKAKERGLKPMLGKSHSQETKDKISVASKKNNLLGGNPNAKLVLDVLTGIYYDCVKEVANIENVCRINLARKLRGERKNNTKYIYV